MATRAIAGYVDATDELIEQSHMLYESVKHVGDSDTDLVLFTHPDAVPRVPCGPHVIVVPQTPMSARPELSTYKFVNSIACMNGDGAETLDAYDYVLKSDLDTFITPAWRNFHPRRFTTGRGAYAEEAVTREGCRRVAATLGYRHYGRHNLGSTFYGTTPLVRTICATATEICRWLVTVEFRDDPGSWPQWFRGVASMYATEIALNHWVPDLDGPTELLDHQSSSYCSVHEYPHVHCWHGDHVYSKRKWAAGAYAEQTSAGLDLQVIWQYCLAMALRSAGR